MQQFFPCLPVQGNDIGDDGFTVGQCSRLVQCNGFAGESNGGFGFLAVGSDRRGENQLLLQLGGEWSGEFNT